VTASQISLVQESFKKVVPIAGIAADLFYKRLFAIAPDVRVLFPDDLHQQKKELIAVLATVVSNLHRIDSIVAAVENLAKRHVGYGVKPEHYPPVGEALIWTLEQGLGEDFTPPVEKAWTETYLTLSGLMQGAAAMA
jgi:hemoglobin-like flavoprotein